MAYKKIVVREADIRAEISKLESHVAELPSEATLRQVEGAQTSVGGTFTFALTAVANATAAATKNVAQEVFDKDSTVRAAIDDLFGVEDAGTTGANQVDVPSTITPVNAPQSGQSSNYGGYAPPFSTTA